MINHFVMLKYHVTVVLANNNTYQQIILTITTKLTNELFCLMISQFRDLSD